jgi:phosphatidyl-myo-inositol alpha-mannosyltransferase
MRIAMYHGDLPTPGRKPGGVTVYVHRLSEALVRRGHDVTVLTFSAPADAAYRVHRLRPRSAESHQLLRQYITPWLWNVRSLQAYDVAHFHGEDWFFIRRRLPTVRTFHGSALREAQHATSLRRRAQQSVVFPLEIVSGRLATASYGVGQDEVALYHGDGCLPIGIETRNSAAPRSTVPSILFVGTWRGRKRGQLVYEMFQRDVLPRLPTAELWMVSDECPTAPGVRWMNAPSDAEITAALSAAWVFCLPSTYEGFGIPYLEAMAQGTPVVATPNPGADTLLAGGEYGVIASEESLGHDLSALLQSVTRRNELSAKSLVRAREYSWGRSCKLHEEAYELATERWRSRGK